MGCAMLTELSPSADHKSIASQDPIEIAELWLRETGGIALATVIGTQGPSPRATGSHMVIRDDGCFAGSVSGGCAEAAIVDAALAALRDGKLRQLEFGVQDEREWNVGLACGGQITVLVEPLFGETARDLFNALNGARRADRPIVRAVDIATGECLLLHPDACNSPLEKAAAEAAQKNKSGIACLDNRDWFLRIYHPPIELIIVGAVHIAQALANMAALLGYRVRVIDPRSSFATAERFPGITLVQAYPDEALQNLTSRSAVVVLSHDPKIDDPALMTASQSPAFYIGALGSKRTQAARLTRLSAQGLSADALSRIHGPVGLAIHAKTPAEIAVSILAEITRIHRQPT